MMQCEILIKLQEALTMKVSQKKAWANHKAISVVEV